MGLRGSYARRLTCRYLVAQLRGRGVAAVGSQPDEAPSTPAWNIYIYLVDSAEDARARVKDAGGSVLVEPFDVLDAGPYGRVLQPVGRSVLFVAGEQAQGRPVARPGLRGRPPSGGDGGV